MIDHTNYVKGPKVELKRNFDQMINQRQNFHDQEAVQHKHSDRLNMRHHPQDEDPYLQGKSSKLEKIRQIVEMIKFPKKMFKE